MLFDVNHYMYAGCYRGYGDGAGGFYEVYRHVFQKIHEGEVAQESASTKDVSHLPHDFGSSTTPWDDVAAFYAGWESFTSTLSFAWADPYDVKEAPSRPVRRAMDDENKKARRAAKKARNDEVQALVRFVKRRDPRVKARRQQAEEEKAERERQKKLDAQQRKRDTQIAKEQWRQQAEEAMVAAEEEDRLAGRVRLADLEDDYDYGGGKKKGKKGKKKKKTNRDVETPDVKNGEGNNIDTTAEEDENGNDQGTGAAEGKEGKTGGKGSNIEDDVDVLADDVRAAMVDDGGGSEVEDRFEDSEEEQESEEEEPDRWWCECCRKEFKSQGQMDNHLNSKKHKQAMKKFEQGK